MGRTGGTDLGPVREVLDRVMVDGMGTRGHHWVDADALNLRSPASTIHHNLIRPPPPPPPRRRPFTTCHSIPSGISLPSPTLARRRCLGNRERDKTSSSTPASSVKTGRPSHRQSCGLSSHWTRQKRSINSRPLAQVDTPSRFCPCLSRPECQQTKPPGPVKPSSVMCGESTHWSCSAGMLMRACCVVLVSQVSRSV